MAMGENGRPSRGFWATLNRTAESPRRADEEWFSTVGEIAASSFVSHDLSTLISLTAKLKKIIDLPSSRVSADIKDRMYGMYLVVKRGATEVRNLHSGFNPVQEGLNAGSDELRVGKCRVERDVFDATVDDILTTGRVGRFRKMPELAARAMATTNPDSLQNAANYLQWLVHDSENLKIRQQANGVLDIVKPSLRIMNGPVAQAQRVCSSYERRRQRRAS